jgi:ribulose-phosphate 3-epimerase
MDDDRTLTDREVQLSVGVNAADPLRLGEQLDELAAAGISTLHFDVFDGRYAGPLGGGAQLVAAVADRFACDVHLMVQEPERHVDDFIAAGAWGITFHPEATSQPHRLLRRLSEARIVRGVALSPSQPLAVVEPLLDELELVLVLGIDPGRRDTMRARTAERVRAVRELTHATDVLVSVDGGVNDKTLAVVSSLRCDLVVAGSAVFADAAGPAAAATRLLTCLRDGARR